MAQQRIVWTVLPHGRFTDGDHAGQLRVSIVASPRLTPRPPTSRHSSRSPSGCAGPTR